MRHLLLGVAGHSNRMDDAGRWIARRAQEAQRHFQTIIDLSTRTVHGASTDVERLDLGVRSQVVAIISDARSQTEGLFASSRLAAFRSCTRRQVTRRVRLQRSLVELSSNSHGPGTRFRV